MKRILVVLLPFLFFATSFYTIQKPAVKHKTETKSLAATEAIAAKTELDRVEELYNTIDFAGINVLNPEVFEKAYTGFENLKAAGKLSVDSKLLTICDFSLSSTQKRLWVINLESGKVLFNSLVAHGKNTGDEYARNFSNTESSYQSSLGFYITEATYNGSNGYSLKLHGMDTGYNDAALQRAIVMHGADYVSEDFIKAQKRIGRSWGCPAVPRALAAPIINTIKERNCLFIYYPDEHYLAGSQWLKNSVN